MNKIKVKKLKIEALQHARKLIQNGDEEYICHALNEFVYIGLLEDLDGAREAVVSNLKRYIRQAFNTEFSYYSLEDWLLKEEICTKKVAYKYRHKARQTRLNWIDWMIACLSEDVAKLEKK